MGSFTGRRIAQALFGAVLFLLGAYFLIYGSYLAWLGDTFYYALAGLLMIASGVQTARGKVSGFVIFAVTWLIALLWAFWECRKRARLSLHRQCGARLLHRPSPPLR